MVILQQPDILSLSGNIKEFRISSTDPVSFTLSQGGVEVLAQSYTPGKDGIITINLRDIVHSRLFFNLQESALVYEQATLASDFVADISGTKVTFRAIRSGVDRLADTATNFLTQNFLTWQPSLKAVTYYSPEFLTYYAVVPCVAKLRAYYTDTSGSESSQQDITLADLDAGKAYTIPLQYASVAAKLGNKLPAYYDVFVESASGARLTYIQRYYASDMLSEQEQWILFENSLGGIDTFRAYGSTEFSADHTHNIAEIDEISTEYRVDTERKFQKNTGHLTKKERTWLLDFFPSQTKYIYSGTYLRPIVVVNSNVAYTDRELPSNYSFTYKYADSRPFLNLSRTDVTSEVLDITVPSVGSFTVPPRLVEFPRLPLTEGALFPIQQPYSEEWSTTTAGALYDFIAKRLVQNNGNNGGVGHEHNNFDLLQILKYADGYLNVGDNKIKVGYADKAGSVDGVDLDLWKKKQDPDGKPYLYTDLPIVTRSGLITYNDDGSINLPDLYAGLPLDGTTIGRDSSGALTVLGGVGSDFDAAKMWATLSGSGAEQINKSHLTEALAGYARTSDIPSLTGYATESWVTDKGYVTTTRLNELIGCASSAFDTLKEIEDYINSHESVTAGLIASLGNKVDKVTGMGLSEHSFTTTLRDKLNSIADGANKYILPVAKAAVLGGVMIGSNINVNAQGVISVDAPYSHPTQQVITAGAARHFLTGLSVNEYGHVTSATSAALTKDDLLAVLKDKDGVIRLDAHIALTGGLINSANLGTVNIPSLYDGIPVDGKSIYWENGTLKSSSTGGGGLAKVIVKVGLAAYESVDGVVTLPAYPAMPDLSNYVTLHTDQNINGYKSFRDKITIYNSALATYNGFELQGTNDIAPNMTFHFPGKHANILYMDDTSKLCWNGNAVLAKSFVRDGGTANQVLRADGGVETFEYSGQSGQPEWVWGAVSQFDHRVWNPANFNVATSVSSTKIKPTGGGVIDVNTLFEENYIRFYNTITKAGSTNLFPTYNNANGILTFSTHPGGYGHQIGFSGDGDLYNRYITNNSWQGTWKKILNEGNWYSTIDGRYLLLTGGSLSGRVSINSSNHDLLYLKNIIDGGGSLLYFKSGETNKSEVGWTPSESWGSILFNSASSKCLGIKDDGTPHYTGSTLWHAGNDGSGSGLDADTLDGMHDGLLTANRITLSDSRVAIKGGFDLNLMGPNFRFIAQYGSSTYWNNAPVGLNYGGVFQMMDSISGIGGQLAWDIKHNDVKSTGNLYFRACNNLGWQNDWEQIAYMTSNVASATKLQTIRHIFGQNFDGTGNVDGDLRTSGAVYASASLYAADAVYASGRIFTGFDSGYSGSISCSNWFRGNGATGWINETYGGGIYMTDSDQVRIYGNKVLYNDGYRVWGIDGHHVGLKLYNQHHIGINLANAAYTWGIYAHNNGNMYIGRRSGDVNDSSGSYYLIIGAGTMTYNGSIVLNGGGLITYSSDIRLKEIQGYFKPSLSELAALPIFAHSWRNGTPGVQLSTSAQAVQKIMPWNVFEGDDGYLKMDGTRTALAVSIRLAQLANEYITENDRWKSDKDRQIEELQREVQSLKQKLNAA